MASKAETTYQFLALFRKKTKVLTPAVSHEPKIILWVFFVALVEYSYG